MKNSIQTLFFLILLVLVSHNVFAVKAYPYPVEITQPDGSKITVILKGDERVKWAQTVDGYSILRNSKGVYEYAILNTKGDMIPSGINAKNLTERANSEIQFLSKLGKGVFYSKSQVGMMKSISKIYQQDLQKTFPTTGSRKLVCILIGFTDKSFTKTQADFNNLFNQIGYNTDGATGSVKDYYKENSYNQLDLTVTVAGPYTAAHSMTYYGANDAIGNDVKPEELVTEAVNLANPAVNYADFDNDNNGIVDGVYVIYAGYGEEVTGVSDNAIWAHAYNIPSLTLDGKTIRSYSCSAELRGNSGIGLARIGVICHEFGHVMGASDYYDTDYTGTGQEFIGTGDWDLMASGSWNSNGATPAHHNPYTKIFNYGWATATTIESANLVSLNNAEQNTNSFYRINTSTSNEYYLVENRQLVGFDAALPGHGMIIYHVDGDYITSHVNNNNINANSHQGMYPVCAGALTYPSSTASSFGNINGAGCAYPGTSLITKFNDYTTPYSRSWAGANSFISIANIAENNTNKTVSFNFALTTDVEAPQDLSLQLKQNYPNPFDQSTTIDFTLAKPNKVTITVYNTLGQVIDVIVDEFKTAGDHQSNWTPKRIAAGIYFYQLKADGIKETKRLIKK